MSFEYHRTKGEESASDLLPSDDGSVREIGRPPSRLHTWAAKIVRWMAGGLVLIWFIATFCAAYLTIWPVGAGEQLIAEDHSQNVPTCTIPVCIFHSFSIFCRDEVMDANLQPLGMAY